MGQRVEAGLAVIVADAGVSNASERHAFDEQVDVHLVDRAAAERQAGEEMIDRLLVAAEKEPGERVWMLLHLADGGIHVLIGQDWKKGTGKFRLP